MTEIDKKDCPVKLPLKKLKLEQGKLFGLINEVGDFIYPLTKEEADFICQACNSHFEQAERIKELEDACEKSLKIINNSANEKKMWINDIVILLKTAQGV